MEAFFSVTEKYTLFIYLFIYFFFFLELPDIKSQLLVITLPNKITLVS